MSMSPMTVHIQPPAIFSILDHAIRRDTVGTQSQRVIGALVGVRSEDGTEAEVRSVFAIPHTENEDQVEVDVDYQKNMLALTLKGTSPRESLLGWYTTSHDLNSFSALIQNFFASAETGTWPHPAIHLTVSTEAGTEISTRCYISAPVGASTDRAQESCLFIQVPHKILYGDEQRAALETIASAKDSLARTTPLASDVEGLARSLEATLGMLDQVSQWVNGVLDEDETPNNALGQFLMNALSLTPKVDPAQIEKDFNSHIQDVLMVAYLANTIRTQIELSQRLATAALTQTEKEGEGKEGEGKEGGGDRPQGGRGGKRGGRGGRGGGRGGGQQREPREPRDGGD